MSKFWSSKEESDVAIRWLIGIAGVWIILTIMVDVGETAELATAIAVVMMGSVLLQYGPEVFQNLGISTQGQTNAA